MKQTGRDEDLAAVVIGDARAGSAVPVVLRHLKALLVTQSDVVPDRHSPIQAFMSAEVAILKEIGRAFETLGAGKQMEIFPHVLGRIVFPNPRTALRMALRRCCRDTCTSRWDTSRSPETKGCCGRWASVHSPGKSGIVKRLGGVLLWNRLQEKGESPPRGSNGEGGETGA